MTASSKSAEFRCTSRSAANRNDTRVPIVALCATSAARLALQRIETMPNWPSRSVLTFRCTSRSAANRNLLAPQAHGEPSPTAVPLHVSLCSE